MKAVSNKQNGKLNINRQISTNKNDILKIKGKMNFMRENIVDELVTHTKTTRNVKSVQ